MGRIQDVADDLDGVTLAPNESMDSARKLTPLRSFICQVVATSSVTLTGDPAVMPLGGPATLTIKMSAPSPPMATMESE